MSGWKQQWVAVAGPFTGAVALAWPLVARAVIDASLPPAKSGTWFGDGLFENLFAGVEALWIYGWFLVIASLNVVPAIVTVVLGIQLIQSGVRTRWVWAGLVGAGLAIGLTGYDLLAVLRGWSLR